MTIINNLHLGLTFQSGYGGYNVDDGIIEDWFQEKIQIHNKSINSFINKYGELSADDILKKIFPTPPKANIFISHSHDDVDEAKKLAYILSKKFHEDVFIDEYIWGSADKLLNQINRNSHPKDAANFDYSKVCLNASSMYILLSNAISKVIHQCNFFVFLKSNNSLGCLTPGHTRSPWIYFELQLINDIIKNEERLIQQNVIKEASLEQKNFSEIAFPADYKSFPLFTYSILKEYEITEKTYNRSILFQSVTKELNFYNFCSYLNKKD